MEKAYDTIGQVTEVTFMPHIYTHTHSLTNILGYPEALYGNIIRKKIVQIKAIQTMLKSNANISFNSGKMLRH